MINGFCNEENKCFYKYVFLQLAYLVIIQYVFANIACFINRHKPAANTFPSDDTEIKADNNNWNIYIQFFIIYSFNR